MRIKSKAGKLQFPFELLPNSSGVVTVVPRILHELSNLPRAPLPLPLPLRVGGHLVSMAGAVADVLLSVAE